MPFTKAEQGKGLTVKYSDDTGNTTVHSGGSRSWRNNNPGNLGCTDFSERHGSIGCDHKIIDGKPDSKAIFPDGKTGEEARIALLRGGTYNEKTIAGLIEGYAPEKGGNPTKAYIASVVMDTNLPRDTKLSSLTDKEFGKLLGSMRKFEGFQEGAISTAPAREEITRPQPTPVSRPHGGSHSGSSGAGSSSGETLKREGNQVYRVEEDGKTRGSFISK